MSSESGCDSGYEDDGEDCYMGGDSDSTPSESDIGGTDSDSDEDDPGNYWDDVEKSDDDEPNYGSEGETDTESQ